MDYQKLKLKYEELKEKNIDANLKIIELEQEIKKNEKEKNKIIFIKESKKRENERLRFEKKEIEYLLYTSISLINDLSSNFNDKIV